MQGKVASIKDTGVKNLDGVTKYQKTYINKSGKETTQSLYMTYRIVHEDSDGWHHPGYAGLKGFDEAERWLDSEIDNILETLID